jgi:hypothetical protein
MNFIKRKIKAGRIIKQSLNFKFIYKNKKIIHIYIYIYIIGKKIIE